MSLTEAHILDNLNDSQKRAVTAADGPLLVVAGPGTGKTLTIVRRIAWLIHHGARPESMFAVTFTNRAAREMKERTGALLGNAASKIFIGTFHLLGLTIIRDGGADGFTILSRDEQIELLKTLMKCPARKAQQAAESISRIKNFLDDEDDGIKEIFEAYQSALRQKNAFDFDDLIRVPVEMLARAEVARKYRDRFTHIIVDEYQDINSAQYRLLRLLAGGTGNLCAVGDSDQAIYSFRGADVGNFLNFEKDFPDAGRITLSKNYRSSSVIINAADSLIRHNAKRIDKELVPVCDRGATIAVIDLPDERAEGEIIIREIEERMGGTSHYQMMQRAGGGEQGSGSCRFSDFAVIFRTNAQAKAIEEAFLASGIPYQVIGRRQSMQSKEIEETLAYLRSLIRPDDIVGSGQPDPREAKFLSAADFFDPRADAVTLMTLHMAKGLEFPVVFITGCEGGLVPCTIMKDGVDMEEERRLFYVGMTRAKEELYLLRARNRFLYGQRLTQSPSPFLKEIPDEFLKSTVVPDRMKKRKEKDSQLGLF